MARKEWDAAECAKEVAKAFYERSTSSRSSTGVEVNIGPSPPLERAHLNKQALSSVARNEIDVCIISFHSPFMLHRLSHTSTSMYEMERTLQPLSNDYKISILLVDGNDPYYMKKLKKIQSLILVGEGLPHEESTIKVNYTKSSDIFSSIKLLEDKHKTHPQISIAFRYGGYAFKVDLEKEGFEGVNVWSCFT